MGGWMDFWFDWFLAIAVYWNKNQNTCRTGQQKDAAEIYQNNGSHVELLRLLIGRINAWLCFIFKLDVKLFPYLVDALSFQDSSLVTDGLSKDRYCFHTAEKLPSCLWYIPPDVFLKITTNYDVLVIKSNHKIYYNALLTYKPTKISGTVWNMIRMMMKFTKICNSMQVW